MKNCTKKELAKMLSLRDMLSNGAQTYTAFKTTCN